MYTAHLATIVDFNQTLRKVVLDYIKDLSEEQLLIVPTGFNNNIAWNLGHIVTTQQLLSYGLGGLTLNIPKHYVPMYSKSTSPAGWLKQPDTKEIKELLLTLLPRFEADCKLDKFANYKEYTTSIGLVLRSIEDQIPMNYGHDMQHIGVIQSLTKLVR
jgi:hypothetical protein